MTVVISVAHVYFNHSCVRHSATYQDMTKQKLLKLNPIQKNSTAVKPIFYAHTFTIVREIKPFT